MPQPPARLPTEVAERLRTCPVTVREPIRFNDMDSYGHVNNAIYFQLFEQARMASLARINLLLDPDDPGIGAILAETRCRYRRPVRFPDTVTVGAYVDEIGPHWFIMHYLIVSDALGALAAEGSARVVVYDYAAEQKTDIPDEIRTALGTLEKRV